MLFITLPSIITHCFKLNITQPLKWYIFDIKAKFDLQEYQINMLYK
jgi:hypothetical protein